MKELIEQIDQLPLTDAQEVARAAMERCAELWVASEKATDQGKAAK